jgi:hypothetical protein
LVNYMGAAEGTGIVEDKERADIGVGRPLTVERVEDACRSDSLTQGRNHCGSERRVLRASVDWSDAPPAIFWVQFQLADADRSARLKWRGRGGGE